MTADMEKVPFPMDMQTKKEGGSSKTRVVLIAWAAVATTLFLFTLIFGAAYVINIKPECEDTTQDNTVTSDRRTNDKDVELTVKNGDKEEKETIHEDTVAHTDFIIKKNSDGYIELIAGVDYNRKMSCVYLAREDVCALSVGEDLDWFDDAPKNTTVDMKDEEETVGYKTSLENKVTDMSLLTTEMQTICSGKDIFWASKEEEEQTDVATRAKRGMCLYSYVIWYRCRLYSSLWGWYYGMCPINYYYWVYC